MSGTADLVHARTSEYLRLVYRTPKHAARDLDATLPTAEGWWAGRPLGRKHFWTLIAHHGQAAIDFIIGPILAVDRDLTAEIAALRAGLQAVEARLREERP